MVDSLDDELLNRITWKIPNALALVADLALPDPYSNAFLVM